MKKDSKIFVAGHGGLVGSAIVRALQSLGYSNIVKKTRQELDLLDSVAVARFFEIEKPEYVFLAAAKVGGIEANDTYPAEFIYENLSIQNNVIHQSYLNKVKKLLFLGSACIYPKVTPQPIKEEYFMTGMLEPTNEGYAIAKIAGIVMCQSYNRQYGTNFISVMPTNVYGPNDNFDLKSSHVLPALIRRFHEAKKENRSEVVVWGTGTPTREFLHVDDLADATVFLMNNYEGNDIINVGTGEDISIKQAALVIKEIVGFTGNLVWDTSKPDGTPRRRLDVTRINKLGWKHKVPFKKGLKSAYEWYENQENKK
ncbi:MAG: GDP-L-fucose synthase [Patescibacteria group bacterium]